MRLSVIRNGISIALLSVALTACGGDDKAQQTTGNNNPESSTAQAYVPSEGVSMNIHGAGASFPALVYEKWSEAYANATGGQVNYQSIGSSNGVKQIVDKTVDFGASDMPLTVEALKSKNLIQFPTVIGGIVPIVNIEGVEAGQLILDGKTLADIYLGKIRSWDDPAIAKLNPDIDFPNEEITTVHRNDGSGTTFNFSYYLNQVSPDWSKVGVGKVLTWPTDAQGTGVGVTKNSELADTVQKTSNSIGYIDYAYAKKHDLTYTALVNRAGKVVKPSQKSFEVAGNVDWSAEPGFYKLIANSKIDNAWPIATTTFILVHKNPENPEQVAGVLNFFNWAYMEGYQEALDLDFVPFSDKPVAVFLKEWNKVVDKDGNPVYQIKSSI